MSELRRVGGTAQDFDNVPRRANRKARSAVENLSCDGLQSSAALQQWRQAWQGKLAAQSSALQLVGEKLVTTANLHGNADQDGAAAFERLPGSTGI
ncbi:MAG: hypothetical protein GEV07_04645 [Streptosporangiales bacterium]|nr:hypothetical protein [Streptosporangiales bacterium]